jgi:uncharacterized integral membrane protein
VNFFFGTHWSAPTVLVVLSAFTLGVVIGVLGMVPRWWRERQAVKHRLKPATEAASSTTEASHGV